MANSISQRPWILDTASAVPVKAGRTFTTGFVFRDYTGGSASQAILKDSRGIAICKLNGNADQTPVGEAWIVPQCIIDLALTTIDSGVVEVIVK